MAKRSAARALGALTRAFTAPEFLARTELSREGALALLETVDWPRELEARLPAARRFSCGEVRDLCRLQVLAALVVLVVSLVVLIHQRGLLSAGEGPERPGRGSIAGIRIFQDIIARNGGTNKDRPWNFDKFSVNLLS